MKRMFLHALTLTGMMACATSAMAWHVCGTVYCDSNGNEVIDGDDTPLVGVRVVVTSQAGSPAFSASALTDGNGQYCIELLHVAATYCANLDPSTIPNGAPVVGGNSQCFPGIDGWLDKDWLVDQVACTSSCWMTAGGVKFEPLAGENLAQCKNGNGPTDSFGGNVYPSCSPEPGDGGHWNHVAHSLNLHLSGQDQTVLRCGNVGPPLPDGTTSPVCNVNFIEWVGTGTVSSIKGADTDKKTPVYYIARVEDHAEPGNEKGAKNQPVDLDKYYIEVRRVADDSLVFQYGTIDAPLSITGGNLQIHCTSCD